MTVLLTVLGVAALSAFLPFVNIELYLVGVTATATATAGGPAWLVSAALLAAVGQMTGKLAFFAGGRGTLRLPGRLRKNPALPGWASRSRFLRHLTGTAGNTPAVLAVVLASSATGLPPLAAVSVLAGRTAVTAGAFFAVGAVGRFLRFAVIVLAALKLS